MLYGLVLRDYPQYGAEPRGVGVKKLFGFIMITVGNVPVGTR